MAQHKKTFTRSLSESPSGISFFVNKPSSPPPTLTAAEVVRNEPLVPPTTPRNVNTTEEIVRTESPGFSSSS